MVKRGAMRSPTYERRVVRLRGFAVRAAATLALAVAAGNPNGFAAPANAASNAPHVKIVTDSGSIVVALDKARAPKTVTNFLHYVDAKFYNGGSFFRAVPGFMIQGGNRPGERPTDPKLALEPPIRTGLRNTNGAISMARTAEPNSATSEFFIDDGDQPTLDGSMTTPGYAAFGHVVSGMDVVRKISHFPAENEMLLAPVKIVKIVRVPGPAKP
jgi:peptidyl-prolyl cis-trans isomerase A (cyclophilin A)